MTNGPTTTGEPHPAAYWSITEDHTSVPVAVSKAHTRASGPRFVTKTSPLATAGLAVIVRPVWVVHFLGEANRLGAESLPAVRCGPTCSSVRDPRGSSSGRSYPLRV